MSRDCWAEPLLATAMLLPLVVAATATAEELQAGEPSPLILAHYMPWYEAKPVSQAWGWHWTKDSPVNGTSATVFRLTDWP